MPTDSSSHRGGRGYGQRGRRGPDRRGPERPAQGPAQQPRGEHVDVEHVMRDIRTRISQRHGIDLTEQQVQELAARRLGSILDVRTVNPALIEQLRRSAAQSRGAPIPSRSAEPPYRFEANTLYDSSRGLMRTIRKLLNPILKHFFNPNPLVKALNTQARLNVEASAREAERDQQQVEWNALHYEILQRLLTEVSKVSLEAQSLGLRVESLAAKVDFNERRVRSIEGARHDSDVKPSLQSPGVPRPAEEKPAQPAVADTVAGDAPRRRRRRRRGRRGPTSAEGALPGGIADPNGLQPSSDDGEGDLDGPDDDQLAPSEGASIALENALAPATSAPAEAQVDASPAAATDADASGPAEPHDDSTALSHGQPAIQPASETDHGEQ